jgi:mevalonate kinase
VASWTTRGSSEIPTIAPARGPEGCGSFLGSAPTNLQKGGPFGRRVAGDSRDQDEAQGGLQGIRSAASAPAKCILLGEHSVVYSEPCLSMALDRRTRVAAHQVGKEFRVNGYRLTKRHHLFMKAALDQVWGGGGAVRFEVESRVPSASGIGSSAALTVATVAALRRLQGKWDLADIAGSSFEAERTAQGRGSPNDTSVSTAGGSVFLAPRASKQAGLRPLWRVGDDERSWFVHEAPVPDFQEAKWVVGHTGVHATTSRQVAKVARFVERSGFARETVRELGSLTWQGLDALREQDPDAFGRIMDQAHDHLVTLGVSHPALERLVAAARRTPGTLGAKLTGAGGGGAMVVLTTRPQKVQDALKRAGAKSWSLQPSATGVLPEADSSDFENGEEESEGDTASSAAVLPRMRGRSIGEGSK